MPDHSRIFRFLSIIAALCVAPMLAGCAASEPDVAEPIKQPAAVLVKNQPDAPGMVAAEIPNVPLMWWREPSPDSVLNPYVRAAFNEILAQIEGRELAAAENRLSTLLGLELTDHERAIAYHLRATVCYARRDFDCAISFFDKILNLPSPIELIQKGTRQMIVLVRARQVNDEIESIKENIGAHHIRPDLEHAIAKIVRSLSRLDASGAERHLDALSALDLNEQESAVIGILRQSADRFNCELSAEEIAAYLPIVKPTPVYPAHSQARGVEGYVVLELTVTALGTVESAKVIEEEPRGHFSRAALNAAAKFKYKPKTCHGEPVRVKGVRSRVVFALPKSEPKPKREARPRFRISHEVARVLDLAGRQIRDYQPDEASGTLKALGGMDLNAGERAMAHYYKAQACTLAKDYDCIAESYELALRQPDLPPGFITRMEQKAKWLQSRIRGLKALKAIEGDNRNAEVYGVRPALIDPIERVLEQLKKDDAQREQGIVVVRIAGRMLDHIADGELNATERVVIDLLYDRIRISVSLNDHSGPSNGWRGDGGPLGYSCIFEDVENGTYMPIVRPWPWYLERSRARGVEGYVVMEFTVTDFGTVRNPKVIEESPNGYFARAAIRAVVKFKYGPKTCGSYGVQVPNVRYRMEFVPPEN